MKVLPQGGGSLGERSDGTLGLETEKLSEMGAGCLGNGWQIL